MPMPSLLWSLFGCFLHIKWLPMLPFFSFPQMTSVLLTLTGQSYSACIPFNETCYKKVLDFATKWKELQCARKMLLSDFWSKVHRLWNVAEYRQCCYQKFCDKARYFLLEFETLTWWNELVNSFLWQFVSWLNPLRLFLCYFHVCLKM